MWRLLSFTLYFVSVLPLGFSQSITLFEDIEFRGQSKQVSLSGGDCKNLLDWNDKASSMRFDDAQCVELFQHINCGGRSVKLTRDSQHLNNFVHLNFNDELTSLKACQGSDNGNQGRDLCVAEHNEIRAQHGLQPLEISDAIVRASQKHIARVEREKCFDEGKDPHQCPGERPVGDRLSDEGYRWGGVGENVQMGSDNCGGPLGAMESWMGSEGHKNNILNPDWKHIGCGRKSNYWACGFARPL